MNERKFLELLRKMSEIVYMDEQERVREMETALVSIQEEITERLEQLDEVEDKINSEITSNA